MASTKRLGWTEFTVRHLILLVLDLTASILFDLTFPLIWLAIYTLAGFGSRFSVARLDSAPSLQSYLYALFFYTLRMATYRAMILYLWFYPDSAAQFPAICMIMAGILFSISQSTRIRSYSIIQGVGDSAVMLIIGLDFLLMGQQTAGTLLSGLCALSVMIYHAASLREMQLNRRASQGLEKRIRQSQKMEAVGRLTGGVAHDFNNILTVVMGNLDLYNEVTNEKERAELVQKAQDAAMRASTLTSQLLAFSRQAPLQNQRVETARFLNDVHNLSERVLPANISLQLTNTPSLWDMQVDQNQLEVALLNLIINARDAMPKGGSLELTASNYDPTKNTKAPQVEGRFVALDLIDEGEGIPEDILQRVFDPFFTTKPVGKGSGLGLSMVQGFVEQSGGDLLILSEEGKGTRVCLLIPAAPEQHGSS